MSRYEAPKMASTTIQVSMVIALLVAPIGAGLGWPIWVAALVFVVIALAGFLLDRRLSARQQHQTDRSGSDDGTPKTSSRMRR